MSEKLDRRDGDDGSVGTGYWLWRRVVPVVVAVALGLTSAQPNLR